MRNFLLFFFIGCLLFFLPQTSAKASHAMGADLTYEWTGPGPNDYTVRVSFFRDCSGITPGTPFININSGSGCGVVPGFGLTQVGTPTEVSPLCPADLANSTCAVPAGTLPGVQEYIYEGTVTLPAACTDWVISYSEGSRNPSVTTVTTPDSWNLYVEATLDNVNAPQNSSPSFTSIPVPYICLNEPYTYNHGAFDGDGDSLSYSLIDAMSASGTSLPYIAPYNGGNPMGSTPPVTMDVNNGNLDMNPNVTNQVAAFAVQVEEWRDGVLIGTTIRDIQVAVINCTNESPDFDPAITNVTGGVQSDNFEIQVCPGQPVSFDLGMFDNDGDDISVTVNSLPVGAVYNTFGTGPINSTFNWTPTAADAGWNSLVVTITDDACPIVGSQTMAIDIVVFEATEAGPDLSYCPGGLVPSTTVIGGNSFTWNTLSGDPGGVNCLDPPDCGTVSFTPNATSTYEVVSDLPGGCKNRDTITITRVPVFIPTPFGDNQTICTGNFANIGVTCNPADAYTFVWDNGATLDDPSSQFPTATPMDSITYNITVTSPAGCRVTTSLDINVIPLNLQMNPVATPTPSCMGDPVDLLGNVSTGGCDDYSVNAISNSPIAGSGTAVTLLDDQVSGALPIGFNFNFFCGDYSNVYLSSNGWLSFTSTTASNAGEQSLPNTLTPNNVIAFVWDDLDPANPGGGTIEYWTQGPVGNRIFIIDHSGVPHYPGPSPNNDFTIQIQLREADNSIEIHVTSQPDGTAAHTMGIENSDGTIGFPAPGKNATTWTSSNEAFRWTQATPVAVTMTWHENNYPNQIGIGEDIQVNPTAITSYILEVAENSGTCPSFLDTVSVDVNSIDAGAEQSICVGGSTPLNAVYTGPPPANICDAYTVRSIAYNPAGTAGTAVTLGDDATTVALPIGFTFNFFCNDYTDFFISSNGYITFGVGSTDLSPDPTPSTLTPNNLIAICWDDMNPGLGGTIRYRTAGAAPNRRLIISWGNIQHYGGGAAINAQIILYENDNAAELFIQDQPDAGIHFEGIENSDGTIGYAVPGRNDVSWTATNDAWRFEQNVLTVSYTWTPNDGSLSDPNIINPVADPADSTVYTLTVDNGNCVMQDQTLVAVGCVFPIELYNFWGNENKDVSDLYWTTDSEKNTSRFEIQRMSPGEIFENVGVVEAAGNTNSKKDYSYTDESPVPGLNYYRLKMIDNDGAFEYSNIVELFFGNEIEGLEVYPNPTSGLVKFEMTTSLQEKVEIDIINSLGVKVKAVSFDSENGFNSKEIDLGELSSGIYLYEIRLGDGKQVGKVTLKR